MDQKPDFDERMQALRESLDLLSVNVHALQDEGRQFDERVKRLDERERRARRALLAGMAAYLRELNGEDASNGDQT